MITMVVPTRDRAHTLRRVAPSYFCQEGVSEIIFVVDAGTDDTPSVIDDLAQRLVRLFLPDAKGNRPCHGGDPRFAKDPAWHDLVLFYEHFHGDTGRGVGASHQTGWTALVTRFIESQARET